MWLFARAFFYPTLWWNRALLRLSSRRQWWNWVDDWVLLGALPVESDVIKLKAEGISAVVNTCEEYPGPVAAYHDNGIQQLCIPTIDYTPPNLDDVQKALAFIRSQIDRNRKTYVHCKAGRGRSATIVMCYLISKGMSPLEAQQVLLQHRPQVLPTLYKRQVVCDFAVTIFESHKSATPTG